MNVDKSGRHAVAFDSGVNDRNKTKGRIFSFFSLHTAIKVNDDSGYLIRKGNIKEIHFYANNNKIKL